MDIKNDEPKISMNVHRRTTQLNLWIIVAVLAFFAAGAIIVFRQFADPPDTTEEMKTGAKALKRFAWVANAC
jgi:hypothetical protein